MKLCLYNLENFFLLDTPLKKPLEKVLDITSIIQNTSPDILMLCEVGGLDSLVEFSNVYLKNAYTPYLNAGNSDRGIEIGFLVKKNRPWTFQHLTHKEMKFSRDVSELRIFKNKTLSMIILLVHLKSKWDREGNDPNGFLKRSLEVELLISLYQKLTLEFPDIPILIAGDFNGIAQKNNCEREFREIYKQTSLTDILDIINLPESERTTFIHFGRDDIKEYFQLDYIFIPPLLIDRVVKAESGIYRYLTPEGSPLPLPQHSYERWALPSDHYPVFLTLDFL